MPVERVISGGQTGADQGGLLGARDSGLQTGGWAPRGYWTEAFGGLLSASDLRVLGLREADTSDPAHRTLLNVLEACGTLIVGDVTGLGTGLTIQLCVDHRRPFTVVPWHAGDPVPLRHVDGVRAWIGKNNVRILNVAGNRESRNTGIGAATRALVCAVLTPDEREPGGSPPRGSPAIG